MRDAPVADIHAAGEMLILGERRNAQIRQLDDIRQRRIVERLGRRRRNAAGHVGNAIVDDAIDLERRVGVRCRTRGLKATTLIDRHVDEHGRPLHLLQHLPRDKLRRTGAGDENGSAARINLEALGYQLTAIVRVSLVNQSEAQLSAFERAVAAIPAIASCYLTSGEDDYVMTVVAQDLADYERLHKQQLSRLPGIARLTSSFALRSILHNPLADLVRG